MTSAVPSKRSTRLCHKASDKMFISLFSFERAFPLLNCQPKNIKTNHFRFIVRLICWNKLLFFSAISPTEIIHAQISRARPTLRLLRCFVFFFSCKRCSRESLLVVLVHVDLLERQTEFTRAHTQTHSHTLNTSLPSFHRLCLQFNCFLMISKG